MELKDARVLVTGGTTGIGRAIVTSLAGQGARVVTFGRESQVIDDALRAFAGLAGEVQGFTADLGTTEGIETIFREVDARLGGLDILVSNAALGAEPIDEMEDEDWRYVVDVNLKGAMACTRGALKRLAGNGDAGGQIVIVGSISAQIHAPGESVYSATKAGLLAFAETLRKEVAERGIRVSLVEPGTVGTDMQSASPEEQREQIAEETMLQAEDIADAVEFIVTRPSRVDVVMMRVEPRLQELP